MQGLHLTADLHHCECEPVWLIDAAQAEAMCVAAVQAAGLRCVAQIYHVFEPQAGVLSGYTATLLLAESHLCLHTWPELQAVTLDVYVCNFGADHTAKAHALMDALMAQFKPQHTERHRIERGALSADLQKQALTSSS